MMNSDSLKNLKGKKVLVFGLGSQGGGLATTNWLIKQGAQVTVTDPLDADKLAASIQKIEGDVTLSLHGLKEQDFLDAEIIVVNPAFPPANPFVQVARNAGKLITNEVLIFYDLFPGKLIGITGTRGKTTTTHWTNHFMAAGFRSTIAGNSSEFPFLKVLDRAPDVDVAVAETPSFQLEYFNANVRTPDIAVVTNVYIDHVNFHGSVDSYADAKANIFRWQRAGQHTILNCDNPRTAQFLKQSLQSQVWLFSATGEIPAESQGVFFKDGGLYFRSSGNAERVVELNNFVREYGQHNLENLLAASLAAHLGGISWQQISERIASLPQVPFRQEVIFKSDKLSIINDTTATSPEGSIAALRRFKGPHTVLIAGGTDRDLDFVDWATVLPDCIPLENVVFLNGSATVKMRSALGALAEGIPVFETLQECLTAALEKAGKYPKSVVLFSPAAKSFEKFKNEYDRGEQFNQLVRKEVS